MKKTIINLLGNVKTAWMMVAVLAFSATVSVQAQEVDLGELELGKEYELTAYKPCKATFTAPETGTLVASCTRSYWPLPYLDAEYTKPVDYKHSYTSTGSVWEFSVEAGVSYYFYSSFLFDGGTFSIDYAATEIKRKAVSPAENTVAEISGAGQVHIEYNMNVSVSDVTLSVGDKVLGTGVAYVSGRNVSIPLKGENVEEIDLLTLIDNGTLKSGEEFELMFTVTSENNPELVLNEKLVYVCPEKLVQLVSADGIDKFLSYWLPGDESGILKLTFDAPLYQPAEGEVGAFVTLQYGNPESDVEGDCYVTQFGADVSGNTLTVDFTGVRRRASDMLTSGNTYDVMLVKVDNVKDSSGRYVYTGGKGSLGSFSYEYPYSLVATEAVYEFTPASGSNITNSTGDIELWIQNYSTVRFDGVTYSYEDAEGNSVANTLALAQLNPEVDGYGDAIIMIPVSEELRSKTNLKVSLANLMFIDGVEREISAVYNVVDVGIEDIHASEVVRSEYFTVGGTSIPAPRQGINIVRQTTSDGKVVTYKKVNR